MKNSNSSLSLVRHGRAVMNWAKVLGRAAVLAALVCALPKAAWAQSNELVNPNLATGDFTGWTVYSAETWNYAIANTNGGDHSNPGTPNPDVAYPAGAQYSLFVYGDYQGGNEYDGMYQDITTVTGGDVFSASGWGYSYADDYWYQNGQNQAWIEVSFRDATKSQILALYRSALTWPAGGWVDLQVTNQYNTKTYAVTNTTSTLVAPPGTADVRFQIVFEQVNYGGGSSFWDDFSLNFISGPVPPTLTPLSVNGLTLCTNQELTCTATSASGTITNAQAIIKTSTLGSAISTTVTNNLNSSTTGLGTDTANIVCPLTSNLIYTVTIVATDNNGITSLTAASFDTLSPTLVIEATDFNFETNGGGGGYIDTPANGGLFLYTNQVGAQGIDENKVGNQSVHVAYRTNDNVVIQNAGSTTFNEQKFAVAGATELCVDYTSVGDWLNYTRTYGAGGSAPAGTYQVWLCLGVDGAGPQTALYQITGDPTSQQQTTNYLGQFGTASFSEQNWAGYEYVPLTDQYGNLVSTTIPSGPQTLRIQQNFGNPNIEYLLLMPVTPILTPSFKSYYPDGAHPFEATNRLTFTVGPNNGSNIASSGITLVLNGVNVTSNPAFSVTAGSAGTWTASYPLQSNAVYTAVMSATNTAGLFANLTLNFDTFNINNYQWEAVDYDFSTNNNTSSPPPQGGEFGPGWISGLFIDNPIPTADITATTTTGPEGEEETNSYADYPIGWTSSIDPFGAGALPQQGIDIGWVPVSGQTMFYRHDSVGTQPATDYVRPKFVAEQISLSDPNIGPFNIGYYTANSWLNYTRHYPTNNYYVWGRLAGGAGPFSGTSLSILTSGYGTAMQTSNVLGTFSDPNATGWQTWHWIPLLDTNGNMVPVSLGGLATLKLTSGNNVNMEFFMLAPAPPLFKVTPSLVAGQLNLAFPTESGHTYMVVYKSSLAATAWTPAGSSITGSGSVTNVLETLTGTQGYYTVVAQ